METQIHKLVLGGDTKGALLTFILCLPSVKLYFLLPGGLKTTALDYKL